jgi:hypothetical protein
MQGRWGQQVQQAALLLLAMQQQAMGPAAWSSPAVLEKSSSSTGGQGSGVTQDLLQQTPMRQRTKSSARLAK